MFIRLTEDHETAAFKFKKGQLTDQPRGEAVRLIQLGVAEEVEHEKAIAELTHVERRRKAGGGRKPKPAKEVIPDATSVEGDTGDASPGSFG